MTEPDKRTHLEEDVCIHVFTVSSAMVGVCLTVIGLIRIVISVRNIDTFADDILVVDATLFLLSSLSAYWALRTRNTRRLHRLERIADALFIVAMVLMVVVCGFIAFAINSI